MARPLSEDKKDAILAAAIELVAVMGTGAPTAKIARRAGVAEGTLFKYFPDKDALLAATFLDLEGELAKALVAGVPAGLAPKERIRHIWNRLIDWSAGNPTRLKALRQLKVSDRIGPESRRCGEAFFADFKALLDEALAGHVERLSIDFIGAVLTALAEITLDFIARDPGRHDHHRAIGFDTFWRAIGR
ncbi:regulatory protein TetR [Sphingobium chlorophenolicum L-1]|uniref:Regulatory protein TetR n=1 Tax=Sphingobium chlorophenolicum L-1 TaxID=690566 RepID=F6F3L6_SPHCR|nr:TetR/AcrR family transcriptional regulator [Sphingobium chlorophenolicum]AEG51028.1 regulatory protein TetR [Sphingobium chlorophenolicum L-1]